MDPPSNKKAKRGLQGFSIDDILSHKTAEVMKEHEQMMKFQQVKNVVFGVLCLL